MNSRTDRASEETSSYGKKQRRTIVIKSKAEMAEMQPPFPDESEWALDLEAEAEKREQTKQGHEQK